MDQQEIEVQLEVLKERQRLQAAHLKDVDECCGKLKGSSQAEMNTLHERIVRLESHVDDNCHDVELEVTSLKEKVKTNAEMVANINSNLTKIKFLIYGTIIVSIAGIIMK